MSKTFHDMEHQRNVHIHNGRWYFYDETGSAAYGPFITEIEAYAGLIRYAREELEGRKTPEVKLFDTGAI